MGTDHGHVSSVVVRIDPGGRYIEVAFGPGFTRRDLACVRELPGRRWDSGLVAWRVPGVDTPFEALVADFVEARIRIMDVRHGFAGGPRV